MLKLNSKPKKKDYSFLIPKGERDWFRPFVFFTLVFQLFTFFLLGVVGVGLWRIALRPVPTLVQTLSGEAMQVVPAGSLYRDPELLKSFTTNMTSLLFSWSGTVQATDEKGNAIDQKDPGVIVSSDGKQGKDKVPTSVWSASFALSEDLRLPFLQGLAQLIPEGIWSNSGNTAVKFRSLGEPEQLEPGKWKVAVVADLLIFDRTNPAGVALPLNKAFYLQAVAAPPSSLPEDATPLQKTVYSSRLSRLEVYQIEDLKVSEDD
ncbi:MAG: hypothetical protein ACRDEA_02385 [Microcystaceae cyanobacterium]